MSESDDLKVIADINNSIRTLVGDKDREISELKRMIFLMDEDRIRHHCLCPHCNSESSEDHQALCKIGQIVTRF